MDELERRALRHLVDTLDGRIKELKSTIERKNRLLKGLETPLTTAGNLPECQTSLPSWRDGYYELARQCEEESEKEE